MRTDALDLMRDGATVRGRRAQGRPPHLRPKPGAYGAGLQALIDSGKVGQQGQPRRSLPQLGQYAYGAHAAGTPERDRFVARLSNVDAIVHNQDNREHDLLDSDDYYQFEGGLAATAETLTGRKPAAYHNDHSRPERPVARTLEEEISRVVRSRVVNPKWIDGVKRHGYKGAFEIIATVDYMFAFAATARCVEDHHFYAVYAAYVEDDAVRTFFEENNPSALKEMSARLLEAQERGLWRPSRNHAHAMLRDLAGAER